MKNFNYNVNAHFEKAETTLRTNDVRVAIQEFFDYVADGVWCDIVNGFTGEVLAIACSPSGEDFATDEMALMFLGHMIAEAWGEGEDDEPVEEEDEVVCVGGQLMSAFLAEMLALPVEGLPS